MVRLTQRSTILLSDSIFVFVLATAQLTAVSSPVVQRHIPWNRKARAGGVWCEAFAPQPAESQGETHHSLQNLRVKHRRSCLCTMECRRHFQEGAVRAC